MKIFRQSLCGVAAFALMAAAAGSASAQTCTSYPNTLTNGSTADATQVMANFNCAALVGAAHFTANVGIGTATPSTQLTLLSPSVNNNFGILVQAPASGAATGNDAVVSLVGTRLGDDNGSPPFLGSLYLARARTDAAAGGTSGNTTYGNLGMLAFGSNPTTAGPSGVLYSASITALEDGTWSSASAMPTGLAFRTGSTGQAIGTLGTEYGAVRMYINSSGDIGIGTITPGAYQLYVNGSAYATGTWSTSDGRLKEHVATVTNGLALIEKLRPVRYDWMPAEKRTIGKDLRLATDRRQIGFIAQEVEKVAPEAVNAPTKGGQDTYSLNEAALVPILTAAIKEQQAEIEDLRAEVASMKSGSSHHKHRS